MIERIKYLIYFLVFILLANCSFDNKTGIWDGDKEEKKLEEKEKRKEHLVKIYSSENVYSTEISATKSITLTEPKRNPSWEMAGLNLQNFIGHLYLSGINKKFLKKKIGKDKFIISDVMVSPLITSNNIIFADDTGSIFNRNAKGEKIWVKNIYKRKYKKIYKNLTFSLYKEKIYVADNIGFIYAMNLKNGKLVWIKNHGIPLKSNVKIFDDKIFLINQDNRLICLDVETGSQIWNVRTVGSFIKSQHLLGLAISKKGELVMFNSSGNLLKIKINNGKIYWSQYVTGSIYDTDFFKSSDIVINDNDIIVATPSSTFNINLNNGYVNWKVDIGSKNTPIIDGNNVFLISDNGYFVNIDKLTKKIIWSTNILKILKKKKRNTEITGFVLGSGKIYATTLNGYLIICSATSGKVEYFKKIGDNIIKGPIISNGSLYILTKKSRLVGFR